MLCGSYTHSPRTPKYLPPESAAERLKDVDDDEQTGGSFCAFIDSLARRRPMVKIYLLDYRADQSRGPSNQQKILPSRIIHIYTFIYYNN
jgi:hypothetical protein